jgi:hypothetical protein
MFLPQAAELDRGRVVTFFGALTERLQQDRDKSRAAYPANPATEEGMRQRDAYWNWYDEHWNTEAIRAEDRRQPEVGARAQRPGHLREADPAGLEGSQAMTVSRRHYGSSSNAAA